MLIGLFCLLFFVGVPIVLTIVNFTRLFTKEPYKKIYDVLILVLGPLFTAVYLGAFAADRKEYYEPVILGGDNAGLHTPIAGEFELSFVMFAAVGLIGMIVLCLKNKRLPPLVSVILLSAVYLGNILNILFCVQITMHINENVNMVMYLYPFNYLLMTVRFFRDEVRMQTRFLSQNEDQSKNRFIGAVYSFLKNSVNWYLAAFIALLPIIGVLLIILILCGQGADGIVKAFTMTADWTFSTQIPPPPEYYEGHYLCTVAAGGHRKVVRPIRYGVRAGERIIVNRQLLIANAFEDMLHDKTPGFHRSVRHFYDTHGYPLSRLITTPLRADIVYILMKPLEYLFLAALYLFDTDPEGRIAMQYTGRKYLYKQ